MGLRTGYGNCNLRSSLTLSILTNTPLFLSMSLTAGIGMRQATTPVPRFSGLFFRIGTPNISLFRRSGNSTRMVKSLVRSSQLLIMRVWQVRVIVCTGRIGAVPSYLMLRAKILFLMFLCGMNSVRKVFLPSAVIMKAIGNWKRSMELILLT